MTQPLVMQEMLNTSSRTTPINKPGVATGLTKRCYLNMLRIDFRFFSGFTGSS